jgi:uncharacterized protein YxeA
MSSVGNHVYIIDKVQHILLLIFSWLPLRFSLILDCLFGFLLFLIASSVFSHSWLPLRFSLTLIVLKVFVKILTIIYVGLYQWYKHGYQQKTLFITIKNRRKPKRQSRMRENRRGNQEWEKTEEAIKNERKPKRQSRMDKQETLAKLGTQGI